MPLALMLRQKAENNLNDLFISIDGLENVHNEIRCNGESSQKELEGIEELNKFDNKPDISIFCCIT